MTDQQLRPIISELIWCFQLEDFALSVERYGLESVKQAIEQVPQTVRELSEGFLEDYE